MIMEIDQSEETEVNWGLEFTDEELLEAVNRIESQLQRDEPTEPEIHPSVENDELWDQHFTNSQLLEAVSRVESAMERDDTKKRRLERGKAIAPKKSKKSDPADSGRCIFFVEDRMESGSTSDERQPSTSTQTGGSVYVEERASTLDDHQPSTSSETGRPVSDERESIFMHCVTLILKIKSSLKLQA